jgi:hypothetical protein
MKEFKFLWAAMIIIALCIIGVSAVQADDCCSFDPVNETPQEFNPPSPITVAGSIVGVVNGEVSISESAVTQSDGLIHGTSVGTFNTLGRAPLITFSRETAIMQEGATATIGSQSVMGVSDVGKASPSKIYTTETIGGMVATGLDDPYCDKAFSTITVDFSDGAISSLAATDITMGTAMTVAHAANFGTDIPTFQIPATATGSARISANSLSVSGINQKCPVDENVTTTKAIPLFSNEYDLNAHMNGKLQSTYNFAFQSKHIVDLPEGYPMNIPICG